MPYVCAAEIDADYFSIQGPTPDTLQPLSAVSQSGCNTIDRQFDATQDFRVIGFLAMQFQHFNLNMIERVKVREAVLD